MSTIEISPTRAIELVPVASASGVTHTYGRGGSAVHALSDVSLELAGGRAHRHRGSSRVAGLQRPTSGIVQNE
jgi:hypothetical protein